MTASTSFSRQRLSSRFAARCRHLPSARRLLARQSLVLCSCMWTGPTRSLRCAWTETRCSPTPTLSTAVPLTWLASTCRARTRWPSPTFSFTVTASPTTLSGMTRRRPTPSSASTCHRRRASFWILRTRLTTIPSLKMANPSTKTTRSSRTASARSGTPSLASRTPSGSSRVARCGRRSTAGRVSQTTASTALAPTSLCTRRTRSSHPNASFVCACAWTILAPSVSCTRTVDRSWGYGQAQSTCALTSQRLRTVKTLCATETEPSPSSTAAATTSTTTSGTPSRFGCRRGLPRLCLTVSLWQ
mmetsp:Transcript_15266/g.47639  ORF Transcript_15266/g.47639 Transcript_15266/m.47639 type:complete len:302 (+) Transcript_15266:592-1497(+)